ncbi:alpha/beta fold hydrolase [Vibrio sonorensis]|uniref:alpha/beta fold hydrolase n=1 Tax=Vibrio sonorensis TaxID=1004316 RepID=UPI0008DA7DEE|nr:alpha/beta fold hydrolase [Vibrio sonorensis]
MKSLSKILPILVIAATLTTLGCSAEIEAPEYSASASLPSYQQDTFAQYRSDTITWLRENRLAISDDPESELLLNAPREFVPTSPNGSAVLLAHGLGDSPYSFIDIGTNLAQNGYLVRTILLSGHGSKVGDLQLATLEDWQATVAHHTKLLKRDYKNVWLGGYSTGANLVSTIALSDPSIQGLLLFSPAFEPSSSLVSLAPYAQWIFNWADQDPEDNPLRYNSLPMNAAAAYYQSSVEVRKALCDVGEYEKPVFITMSEGDGVIDQKYVLDKFNSVFTHRSNYLMWLGDASIKDKRAHSYTMNLPKKRISNGSHMGLLFSPENPLYGETGELTICSNGQGEEKQKQCEDGEDVWYSAWGYTEENKIHARLTYNPYFKQMMKGIYTVMEAKSLNN